MSKPYGILALFETAPTVYEAAKVVRDAGFKQWDVLTPFPVHGMDEAMGLKRSKVPIFTFLGGFTGFWTGNAIAYLMGMWNYPLIVGGKPYFSFVFPFPVAYELTILLAAFGTLGGMFLLNRLPMHYHPVLNYDKFRHLTDDKFAIVIETDDPNYDPAATRSLLESLGPVEISEIPAGEEEAA
jgi:hypothetical protein